MNKKKKRYLRYIRMGFILHMMILLITSSSIAQQKGNPNFDVSTSVISTGGGLKRSAHFGVQGSIGQPSAIGISQSQNFGLFAGFQPTTMEGFVLPAAQRGDVNGDMSINVLDVLATVNHILDTIPLTGNALVRADCNGDGEINVLDALGIVNVILGIGECEP